jgi:hypothetical protein
MLSDPIGQYNGNQGKQRDAGKPRNDVNHIPDRRHIQFRPLRMRIFSLFSDSSRDRS